MESTVYNTYWYVISKYVSLPALGCGEECKNVPHTGPNKVAARNVGGLLLLLMLFSH